MPRGYKKDGTKFGFQKGHVSGMCGKKHSLRAIGKMRLTKLGRKHSEETKLKQSLAHKGNKNPMYGRHLIPWNRGLTNTRVCSQETKLKIRNSQAGEKSHCWKGGMYKLQILIRQCFQYRQWRSDVFTRDNFICQKCGNKKGGNLEAHHNIKSFSKILQDYKIKTVDEALGCVELWNINNGKTLCCDCHNELHNKHKEQEAM